MGKTEVPPKQYRCQFQLKFPQEAKNRYKKDIRDKITITPDRTKISEVRAEYIFIACTRLLLLYYNVTIVKLI